MDVLNIVIIVVVLVVIYKLLKYMFSNPYTIQDIQDGKTASTISASTLSTNGSNVPSSNFAYSVWFYINDWNYRYGEAKVIFGRMGGNSANSGSGSISGISGVDPCPAVILDAIENNISVSLGCYPGLNDSPTTPGGHTIVHTCSVSNVPIQKWVNLIVSVYGRTMDLYLDGKLVRTCLLPGVASINNNADIYVTPLGGFDGSTSKLQYYPNSLNPQDAWNIYTQGYSNWYSMSSIVNAYHLQLSILQNGAVQNSVTI